MTRKEAENIVDRIVKSAKESWKESSVFDPSGETAFINGWLQSAFAGMLCDSKMNVEEFDENGYYKKYNQPA